MKASWASFILFCISSYAALILLHHRYCVANDVSECRHRGLYCNVHFSCTCQLCLAQAKPLDHCVVRSQKSAHTILFLLAMPSEDSTTCIPAMCASAALPCLFPKQLDVKQGLSLCLVARGAVYSTVPPTTECESCIVARGAD